MQRKYCSNTLFTKYTSCQQKHLHFCRNYLQYKRRIYDETVIACQVERFKIQQSLMNIITLIEKSS